MVIDKVELRYFSTMPHLSMIITGFQLLAQKGIIKHLIVKNATSDAPALDNTMIVEATIDSTIKVAYDVCDGYVNFQTVNEEYAASVDYYFMRSFSEEINKKFFSHSNVLPLGMNYYCTCKNNPLTNAVGLKNQLRSTAKRILSKFNPQISVAFDYKDYESAPSYRPNTPPNIMFNTRLWNPTGDVGEAKWDREHPERIHINKTRIDIIQQARQIYGKQFSGGLYDTQYARKTAPADLLLSNSKTTKKQYLKAMHASDICIGSEGLHGSIGWKTAEYVASSKAILMERPKYQIPGNFQEGIHYLGFSDAEECMAQLEYLSNHPEKIVEMQNNNHKYYNEWLRPDMQILKTLELVAKQ